LLQNKDGDCTERINQALVKICHQEFSDIISTAMELDPIRGLLQLEQEKKRQKSFPLLEKIALKEE
jgi:hypothetical protein